MMTDYASLKVPDLKKLLQERSLQQSGNKADLIARLQEHDKSQAEDVIDWDDDDTKVATAATKKEEPKPAAPAAAKPQADTPAAPPAATVEAEPAKSVPDPAVEAPSTETKKQDAASTPVEDGASAPAEEKPAEPSESFAIGLEASNADEELKKREARAKRFGIATDSNSEEAKKLERAKKFGVDNSAVVKGLDAALPERRPKRGRDQGDQTEGGGKRQHSERRNGGQSKHRGGRRGGGRPNRNEGGGGGGGSKILTDPTEKAKAEARAKRFGGGN